MKFLFPFSKFLLEGLLVGENESFLIAHGCYYD